MTTATKTRRNHRRVQSKKSTHTVTTIKGIPHILDDDGEYYVVVDATDPAMLTLGIQALRAGLKNGVPGDDRACFYVTAIMAEKSLGVISVRVRKSFTYLRFTSAPNEFVKYVNPDWVKRFIQDFDDSEKAVHFGHSCTLSLLPVPASGRQGYRTGMSGNTCKVRTRQRPSVIDRRAFR